MNNENLKKLYNTLVTPSESTQNRALFDKSQIGANPEEFAKILSNADNAKMLYDALLTPKKEFGDKSLFDKSQIGSSVEDFSNIFGVQKKNPIVTEFTSGFAPSQPIKQGTSPFLKPTNNVTITPFESKNEEWKTIHLPKDGQVSDKEAATKTGLYTIGSGIAATPRYAYDIVNAVNEISKKAFGSSAESLPSYDKLRELTRQENAINILDQLDVKSKRYASEAKNYAEKISTNKKGYIDAISDKDFGFLIDKTVNDLLVSAPSMLAISINPTMAATVFSSSKNLELVDSTTVPDELKPINALFNGLAEVILEGRIGGTAVFKNTIAKMLKNGQKEAAGKFIEKTVNESIKKWAKKSYGASKELSLAALEEMGTDFTQQVTSYLTGESDKINIKQTLDAGAGGLSMAGGMKAAGKAIGSTYQYGIKPVTMKAKEMIVNNTKKKEAIINDIDNPNISVEDKSILIDELSNENEREANIVDNELKAIDNLDDASRARLDFLSGELTNLVSTSMDPNISEDTRVMLTDRLTNIQKEIDNIVGDVDDIETEADDINDLKDITEVEEVETILPPIAEKAGESVTVNIGGKAITGRVYVDEGGKSTIETGGKIYELAPDVEYVDYASPIRLADDGAGIEFNGNTYQDVSFETFDGVERAILVDDNNNVQTITDPKLLEEIKYQSALSDNELLSDDDVEQLTKIYDTRKQTETAPTSEEDGVAVPQGTEQNDKIQEALDEIDLIEQIALLYINETENAAKLVEAKVGNKNKVYLVSKNQDGSYSATLDGKKVRKGEFLNKLGADFDEQTKQQSKALIPVLQKQVNKHKRSVERKLFKVLKKPKKAVNVKNLNLTINALQKEIDDLNAEGETNYSKRQNLIVQGKIGVYTDQIAALKNKDEIIYRYTEDGAEKEVNGKITPLSDSQFAFAKVINPKGIKIIEEGQGVPLDVIQNAYEELSKDFNKKETANLKKEKNATKISEEPITQGGEQGGIIQREGIEEGQPQAGEREGGTREAKKPKADNRNRPVSSKEEQKVEETKPALKGLTETEKKYKEDPNSLTKDELKDVLKTKQDRLKKANLALEKNAALEKSELTAEEIKAKKNGIAVLEKAEEDLIKRINSGVVQKVATKSEFLATKKDEEGYANSKSPKFKLSLDPALVEEGVADEIREIIDQVLSDPNFSTSETIIIDNIEGQGVPTEKITIDTSDGRAESLIMSKLRIGLDFIYDKAVGLGMSDTLTTGSKILPVMNFKTGKIEEQEVRNEGGIGFPFKSLLDLLNGVETNINKILAWAAVGSGAAGAMMNAAERANKITGSELKEMYFKSLGLDGKSLTKEKQLQKDRLEKAIPNNKEYGLVTIYKMGNDGILSNEAFARETFRQIETKLTTKEKKTFLDLVKERAIGEVKWEGKNKYQDLIRNAKSLSEIENIITSEKYKLSLEVKAAIMQVLILSTEETVSTKSVNAVGEFLKAKGISIESITRDVSEPIMDGITKGQPMILLAVDFNGQIYEDTNRERHQNYPFSVPGFPIGVFNETAMLHNLSPEMMDTFVKTATVIEQKPQDKKTNKTVELRYDDKSKAKGISIYLVVDKKETFLFSDTKDNINIRLLELGYQPRLSIFQKNDGLFYVEEGKGVSKLPILNKAGDPLSDKSIDGLYAKLNKLGKKISKETSSIPYSQKINGTSFGNLFQKAKTGFIQLFNNPKLSAQQKLVKLLQMSFPGVTVEMSPNEYESLNKEFVTKKLINKNGNTYGFIKDGRVYLNPTYLNNNTPIHEYGHIWNAVAKQYRKDIYAKGVQLVENSKYFDFVLNSPEYIKVIKQTFGNDAIKKDRITGKNFINTEAENYAGILDYVSDEALAKAIGDNGELFVNETQKKDFIGFLKLLFLSIQKAIGFDVLYNKDNPTEQWQNLTLEQFTNAVLKELLGGKEISDITSEDLSKLNNQYGFAQFSIETQDKNVSKFVNEAKQNSKIFQSLITFGALNISQGKVKSIDQLARLFKSELNIDFNKKYPAEFKDLYNKAKETIVKNKKERVKTTIIRTTEGRTSKEKLDVTFKDWITRLYTEVEKGAKISAKNRSQLINDAIRYINLSNIKNLSKPKIISLVKVAANLTKYENVDQFVKYVDSVVEQADYYAKVKEAENLAEALNKKVKKEKLGQITNLVKRLLMVDVNNITEQSLDDYINLMNDLTNGKVADVTALSARLAQFVGEEREVLEGKILSNIISERELIAAIDILEALNNEQQSEFLEATIKKTKEREYEVEKTSLVNKFIRLNEAIKEYLPTKVGNKVTPAVKRIINLETYKDLIKSIKGFNRNLSRMKDMGLISDNTFDLYNIDFESEEFKELNYELKEIVDKFRKSLVDQIKQYKKSIQNQLNTTGIRAKLFQNMPKVEKDIYAESIDELLSLDDDILNSLDAVTLDEIFNGYEQLNNGYVSPTILNAINKLKQIANYNSLKEDYKKLQKAEEASDQKVSMFQKDISSLKNSEQVYEYIKTLKANQIATYLSGGMSEMFLKYIYKPFEKAYTEYRKVKENLLEKVTIIDDSLGSGEKGDIIRNAVGIFLIQEDLFRYKNFDKLEKSKRSLVDYIIDQYENNGYLANEDEMDLLKKARTQVWGELGSKSELEKTKAAYFLKYPKAKLLYDEIRKSIDEKVYPLIKIAAETDGRYFEFDENYFPVQRRGKNGIDSVNAYEQYFNSGKNDNVKLVANATYSRVGDPITMRQFNATKAYFALSEDAARVAKLKPFVSPFNLSIDRLTNELSKEKDVNAVKFLQASKEYMHVSMKMLFEKKEYSFGRQLRAKLSAFQRNTLLGQVYRLPADFLAALTKLSTSINPSDLIRHLIISQKFNKESFEKLADLTSSPIIFKTSQMKIDAQAIDKKYGEKRIDRIAGSADVKSASIAWKVLFLREFNRISGSDFNFTEFNKDPKAYYKNNKQMMDDAAFAADNFVDTKFVNQSELGKAPVQKVIFGYTTARNSELFAHINTLNSYIANDAAVVATASRRLLTKGDIKGFTKDVLPIVISQYVYSITLSFFMGVASSLGYALMGAPSGDEEDKDRFSKDYFRNLYQYTTETLGFFNQQTFNADFFKNATLISLFSMMTGRYTLIAKAAGQFVVGIGAQFDVNTKQTPAEKKKAVKKWASTFEAINDKLYVSPITLNEKSYELRTDASDIIGMVPVYGYFAKEIYRETNPKNPLTIAAGIKELNSKDPQALDAIAGLTNASLFAMTYAGLASAPTISKTFRSYAKMENDKKYKDKEKPKGSEGYISSGFGGFSGGGFSGGMSGGGFGK
jgi:hypothetical protein